MRLEHLVVQREELEERTERLDAVIGLIRRDLSEGADEPSATEVHSSKETARSSGTGAKDTASDSDAADKPVTTSVESEPEQADDYDF